MRCRSGKCRESHDKHTGSYSCFQLISKHRCQNQQHHHSTTGSDKSTDKSNQNSTHDWLNYTFLCWYILHALFRCHDRSYNKFDSKKEGHEYWKVPHRGWRYKTRYVTSNYGKGQYTDHHDHTVLNIQIPILSIYIRGYRTCQYIRWQSNTYRHIRIHPKKCDEHGTDHSCSTHTCKARSKPCSHSCKKCYDHRP